MYTHACFAQRRAQDFGRRPAPRGAHRAPNAREIGGAYAELREKKGTVSRRHPCRRPTPSSTARGSLGTLVTQLPAESQGNVLRILRDIRVTTLLTARWHASEVPSMASGADLLFGATMPQAPNGRHWVRSRPDLHPMTQEFVPTGTNPHETVYLQMSESMRRASTDAAPFTLTNETGAAIACAFMPTVVLEEAGDTFHAECPGVSLGLHDRRAHVAHGRRYRTVPSCSPCRRRRRPFHACSLGVERYFVFRDYLDARAVPVAAHGASDCP